MSRSSPLRVLLLATLLLPFFAPQDAYSRSRTFLYREANLAAGYSVEQQLVRSTPLPVPTSLGLEFIHSRSNPRRGSSGLVGIDVHLRLMNPSGQSDLDFYFMDTWALFRVGGARNQFRIGHFNIPFGINPVMEPRGNFRMPLEAIDLGFKKDWGFSWQREAGGYDIEAGAFMGMGGDFHWRRGSYLFAGRVGTPTFKEVEYGISFIAGDTPMTMGMDRMNDMMIRRIRGGMDAIYMYGTHMIFKGELSAGTDDGQTVMGALFSMDWIPPTYKRWNFGLQSTVLRKNRIGGTADWVSITLEATFSIADETFVRLDAVRALDSPMGSTTDFYLLLHHYGR